MPERHQRIVLRQALSQHSAMSAVENLSAEIDAVDAAAAVGQLVADFVVERVGGLVSASWIAMRVYQVGPV